jgi:preprotein translocase subunit Sec63
MATRPDYYRILQVHPGAEREVVDAAYRKLAAKYHPDVSQVSNAAERMKQINIAYEVLSDPSRRAAYDASRGVAPSPDNSPHAAARSHHASRTWRNLLIAMGLILLAVLVVRAGPVLLRLVVPLVVISLVVWLIFTMTKPRR